MTRPYPSVLLRAWTLAPDPVQPAPHAGTEYTAICGDDVCTFRYSRIGVPEMIASRTATLAEIGTPWADTYIGHPDKPSGTLTSEDWGRQIYVGDMTRAEFREHCRNISRCANKKDGDA